MSPAALPDPIDNPQSPEFASWKSYYNFEERVKRCRRHIWDEEISAFLETVMQTHQKRQNEIPEGAILWRAQLGVQYVSELDASGEEEIEVPIGFYPDRMKPVVKHAREGRANSSGIPVLYLASTELTAISEVRPWVGSEVSLARFRVVRDLNVIDLTHGFGRTPLLDALMPMQRWNREEPDAEAKEKAVWIAIDNAFSRPVTLSDDEENYIPTRILAELFQEAGYDALVYQSQFGEEGGYGYNVAIFKLEDAEILNCTPHRVESIKVHHRQIGNSWYARP